MSPMWRFTPSPRRFILWRKTVIWNLILYIAWQWLPRFHIESSQAMLFCTTPRRRRRRWRSATPQHLAPPSCRTTQTISFLSTGRSKFVSCRWEWDTWSKFFNDKCTVAVCSWGPKWETHQCVHIFGENCVFHRLFVQLLTSKLFNVHAIFQGTWLYRINLDLYKYGLSRDESVSEEWKLNHVRVVLQCRIYMSSSSCVEFSFDLISPRCYTFDRFDLFPRFASTPTLLFWLQQTPSDLYFSMWKTATLSEWFRFPITSRGTKVSIK